MNEDSPFSEMIEQLKQVVVAVTALSHGPINTNELHKIVMNVEGFEEDMLDEAFDHWLMMKRYIFAGFAVLVSKLFCRTHVDILLLEEGKMMFCSAELLV
ncbi:hypothetical protein CFP56_011199 [Quercus suber]|uniref:Uncharacterized protein n=1 Tax=Quercus suber TaxID=58331 RepID=A0AAW0MEK6_QUESU